MKLLRLLMLLAATVLPVKAADEWTGEEVVLESVYMAALVMDLRQTDYIAGHPGEYEEVNPALKSHPSESDVRKHFAAGALAHWLISDLLTGTKYKKPWQVTTLAIQIGFVAHNYQIGLKVELAVMVQPPCCQRRLLERRTSSLAFVLPPRDGRPCRSAWRQSQSLSPCVSQALLQQRCYRYP